MKNVKQYQLCNAIVKSFDQYQEDVRAAFGDPDLEVGLDGSICGDNLYQVLASYYGVSKVTSVHADGTEYRLRHGRKLGGMIYTALTIQAMKVAYACHSGQTDKAGMPYIFHPYHIAEQMTDEVSVCVALLHDVAEDSDDPTATLERLAEEFPPEVMNPLRLLTHTKGVPYAQYIRALRDDPVANMVKRADIAHNLNQDRWSGSQPPSSQTIDRLTKKYTMALDILTGQVD